MSNNGQWQGGQEPDDRSEAPTQQFRMPERPQQGQQGGPRPEGQQQGGYQGQPGGQGPYQGHPGGQGQYQGQPGGQGSYQGQPGGQGSYQGQPGRQGGGSQPYAPPAGQGAPYQQHQQQSYGGQNQGNYGNQPGQYPPANQGAYSNQPSQPYGSPVADAKPAGISRTMLIVGAVCALIAIISCFLPWAKFSMNAGQYGDFHANISGFGSVSGNVPNAKSDDSAHDGVLVTIAAVIALGAIAFAFVRAGLTKILGIVAAVMGLAIAGIAAYDWSDISDKAGDLKKQAQAGMDVSAGIGYGIIITLLTGLGLIAAGVIAAVTANKQSSKV